MNFTDAPGYIPVPFANGASASDRNTIPVPSQQGTTPGAASFTDGFPPMTFQPISAGGVPPFGADFNGILFDLSAGQRWQQAGGVYEYDATFCAATGSGGIGGYPKGAMLLRADGHGYWLNLADGNATDPDTGGANWAPVRANVGTSSIAVVAGNNTPAANVLAAGTLLLTGSIAAAATLVLPLTAGASWIVVNNTTGSGSVNIAGASGAGVSIAQAVALNVFTDGTNYYAVAAPTTGQYLPINGTAVAATRLATPRAFSIGGLATAAAINFDGTGNVTFNVTALNVAGALGYTPANDANVVHIAGTETITGQKTFTGVVDNTGSYRAQGNPSPSSGAGVEMFYSPTSSVGVVQAYDRTAGAYKPLQINGSSVSTNSSVAVGGSVTCTTMNATSSDRRLKRNVRKFAPRPLHRSARFVSYTLKTSGWHGLGSIAQDVQKVAPEHVGEFEQDGKKYLSLNYAGMAYEQAVWASREVDRLTDCIAKLEKKLARASIHPRQRGLLRLLLEAIW